MMNGNDHNNIASLKQQQGSLLLIAVVIILVMSVVGISMVSILQRSAQSVVAEVYGTRAYQAAQSGLQVVLTELYPLNIESANAAACFASTRTFIPTPLSNCEAVISCAVDSFSSYGIERFSLLSQGICEVGGETYSRELAVEAFYVSD